MRRTRRREPAPGPDLVPETRAEIARRRLAQLAASFETAESPGATRQPIDDEDGDTDLDADEAAVAGPRPGLQPAHRRRPIRPVHLRAITVVAVAAGILLTWWVLAERPRSASVADPVDLSGTGASPHGSGPTQSGSAGSPQPSGSASSEVVVDVAGKVRKPGIVTLPAGSRVHEAIKAAGGLRGKVDVTGLNLARVLSDGEQILVGVASAPTGAGAEGSAGGGGGSAGGPVNLNSATLEQLDGLPGVGPVTAQAILDWRTENGRFTSVDDLLQVRGIGDKTLEDLRDLVAV